MPSLSVKSSDCIVFIGHLTLRLNISCPVPSKTLKLDYYEDQVLETIPKCRQWFGRSIFNVDNTTLYRVLVWNQAILQYSSVFGVWDSISPVQNLVEPWNLAGMKIKYLSWYPNVGSGLDVASSGSTRPLYAESQCKINGFYSIYRSFDFETQYILSSTF